MALLDGFIFGFFDNFLLILGTYFGVTIEYRLHRLTHDYKTARKLRDFLRKNSKGVIGGLVGGVAGYLAETSSATASAQAEVAARQAEINAIYETVDSIISLNEANATLTNTLSDIDATEGLTTERQIELKLEAGAQGLAAGGATKNIGANAKLAKLAERTGISAAVLKTKTGEDVEKLTDTKTGEAIGSVGRAAFETAMMEASSSAELVGSNLKASADVYKQAGSCLLYTSDAADE